MTDAYYATLQGASELAGVSERQLRDWDASGILRPWISDRDRRPFVRLYAFDDLVALRILAAMRGEVGSTELRKIHPWVKERHMTPWEHLGVEVRDRRLHFIDSAGEGREGDQESDEARIRLCLEEIVDDLRADIERQKQRKPDEIGRITRQPGVMGNAWVLAGTRIPTSAVWDFHDAGYDMRGIIEQYPPLTPEDIRAAIDHELKLRAKGAA